MMIAIDDLTDNEPSSDAATLLEGRFGLYLANKGQPDTLVGRFNSYYDVMERCGNVAEHLVEIARYAYVTPAEFADLFGPLRRSSPRASSLS
jgi:hypothetical protein